MVRTKFKAKRIDNEDWVEGNYFKAPLTDENSFADPAAGLFFLTDKERHCIECNGVVFTVDVKTLRQYTGINDIRKKEIYEKEKVKAIVTTPGEFVKNGFVGVVEFLEGQYCVVNIENEQAYPLWSETMEWELIS